VALKHKERLFVSYYLGVSNGNATDAAVRAGYGSSRASAKVLGCRLSEQGEADIADFIDIDPDGGWKLNLRKAKRRGKTWLIGKLKETKDGPAVELKSSDFALGKLGQYHGLWDRPPAPDVNIDELLDESDRIADERERPPTGGAPGPVEG
jgi:hypothetical protein